MKDMRRAAQKRPAEWALEVFDKAPYVSVGMIRPDGTPYVLPLSLVRSDEKTFYFHCARDGEKMDCLDANPIVSLSAVSKCSPHFEDEKKNYTEYFHSAIAVGRAERVEDKSEKTEALRLICCRFLPGYLQHFENAIERSLEITTIIKITLSEPPVGKCKP